MKENSKPYDDRQVTGKELAGCFENLKKSLGRPVVETVVYELEIMHGIMLESRFSYRLSEIEDALKKLLGDSAAELMMESIVKQLSKR
ncbi:MAG TPA: hypothetical protein VFS46_08065 [Nitrososphaera sp.]|nr:hypothetical protein [Nitrososphaera sp.]